jgi:hypothetical protein
VLVLSFSMFGLAGLVRYQMWSVALPALVGIIIYDRMVTGRTWRQAVAGAGTALGSLLITVLVLHLAIAATFSIRRDFTEANLRYSMLYDIAAVLSAVPDTPMAIFTDHRVDLDTLRARARNSYTPYNGDPLGIGVGATDEPAGKMYEPVADLSTQVITAQWLDVIWAAPAVFVASRLERFAIFLGLGRVYGCSPLDFVGFSGTPPDKWQALGGPGLHEAYVTHLLRSRVFPAGTFLFRPVTYLLASIALMVVLIFTSVADVPLVGGLITGAWIYWLTFLPLPVACEVRYSYFSCIAVMFALAAWCLPRLQARRVEFRGRSAWATGSGVPDR